MITIRHTHEDGTLVEGTVKGDGVYEILKPWPHRFRYFPSIGMIGIQSSRDRVADRYRINTAAEALRAAGHGVTVEIDDTHRDRAQVLADQSDRLEDRRLRLATKAERHAGRAAAAADRANGLSERFAGGQPILVGHHSERGARRDQQRMDAAMRTSIEEDSTAQDAARRANAVGRQAAYSARPRVTARRIKTAESELRVIQKNLDGYKRRHLKHDGTPYYIEEHKPATGDYRERLLARQAQLNNQLAYDREQLAAATDDGEFVEWGKHNIHVGDRVWAWGYNGLATKTNPTTVRVGFRDHWQPLIKYTDVLQVECPHGDEPALASAPEPARPQSARPKIEVSKVDIEQLRAAAQMASNVVVSRDREAFVSPPAVVARLMEVADIQPGMAVLEPSAGTGNIAAAAVEAGAVVDCVELDNGLANVLVERVPGVNCVRRQDFLELDRVEQDAYDRVVMNPPFSGGQDIAHVTHALSFVKPGGRLVAVMGAGVTFHKVKVAVEFRQLIEDRGGDIIPLPPDAFTTSGTTVNTVIVVIPC
ncbi:DUF3560 domain-containing protein [Streptosporangium sp. NPDC049248]|uniref:DUF3560 domain-containing protein n=1 Tax=Streptosporangium sp. NPDC049248 TaxID=3155651 RepID=UPI00343CEB43